jgi:hypothetical protein
MQGSSQAPDVNALFQSARQDDVISAGTLAALQVVDLGAKIADALGTPADQIQQSEVILLSVLVDDSGSIRFEGNTQAVRDGHNLILDALRDSKQQDNILAHTRLLNGEVIYPYGLIDSAVKLDQHNYDPDKGTPLYDESMAFLATVLAKSQEFADQGVPCRTISLIITDGADQHSRKCRDSDVKKLVDDMLRQENHIIAAMGIKDDAGVNYQAVFQAMGIRDEWILTPDKTPSDIRKACQVFSRSAVRASQSAGNFSQQALGGFGG